MTTTIAFCNQKGGACKTTTASAFAAYLAREGERVLCVDLDQQGSLSYLLGAEPHSPGVFEVLVSASRKPDASAFLQRLPMCDLLAGDERLVGAEVSLMQELMRERRLRESLESVACDYDYILLDTPPALSVLMLNALVAADQVVIPTNATVLHAKGMSKLFDTIESVRASVNPSLEVAGIVLTMCRTVRAQEEMRGVVAQIAGSAPFAAPLFEQTVRMSVVVEEAQRAGKDLFGYRSPKTAPVVADYAAVVEEYLARQGIAAAQASKGKGDAVWAKI